MLMQRYHNGYPDWENTPEWFMDEVLEWIGGEVDAGESRKHAGVKPGEERIEDQARSLGLPLS